jgi:predicted RNase H-like HicB family nuclease
MTLTICVKADGDKLHSWSPELKGCHSFGKSIEIAVYRLTQAMRLYMEEEIAMASSRFLRKHNKKITKK